jgi:cation:H+ antiporter
LLLLVVAGRLIVPASRALAAAWGIDDYVIGATVVALGTSTPELATALVSKLRGHEEVGLGTLLGSNLFNALFIVAVAALIHPIPVRVAELLPTLGAGVLVALLVVPDRSGALARGRGALLLCCYAAYVASLLRASV